jgi:hypothetical protein
MDRGTIGDGMEEIRSYGRNPEEKIGWMLETNRG